MPSPKAPTIRKKRTNEILAAALLQAETDYITDPDRRTPDFWWEKKLGRNISLADLRAYAVKNKWAERRQSFWRGVQAAWLKETHIELIRSRSEELNDALSIRSIISKQLKPTPSGKLPFKVNSYEGLLRAFCAIDSLIEGKRDAVMDSVEPLLAAAEADKLQRDGQTQDLPFSKAEMRSLAHQLLRSRRKTRRANLMIEEDYAEDDPDEDIDSKESDGHEDAPGPE